MCTVAVFGLSKEDSLIMLFFRLIENKYLHNILCHALTKEYVHSY